MMQQGLASLTPPQGMAPGQAAPQPVLPQQQSATPQAVTGTLERLPPQQLLSMYNNPQDMTPKWAVATAYAKAIEQARLMQMAQGQSAMAQSAAQAQQPPVVQQIMSQPMPGAGIAQGFSGGGAVAFNAGGRVQRFANGSDPFGLMSDPAAYLAADTLRVEAAQRNAQIRALQEQLAFLEQAGAPQAATVRAQLEQLQGKQPQASRPQLASRQAVEDRGFVPDMAPQRAPRPGTGRPATTAAAAPAAAPATGIATPVKPDNWADIESQGLKGIAALQDVYRKQGEVDPELARLRAAAYESAQGIAQRRERDRLAALEAAQKAASAPLMDNQEALLRLAGSIGGKMRFGEALSAMTGAAGGIRGEQRKALEVAQRESRAEQNAIDQLNQALAEKRVADRSGDVDRMRAADTKVAEAQLKVTDLRTAIGKERATEADRAEQRRLTERGQDITQQTAREQMANALKVAGIGAAGRNAAATDPRKIFDTLMDNARAEYDKWVKTPEGARSSLKPELARAKQVELLEQQVRLAQATGVQGLEPLLAAVRQGGASGTSGQRVVDFSSIK